MNPKTSSLQEVLLMYLKITSHYALPLAENNISIDKIESLILDTLSIMITNPEFSEKDFYNKVESFNKTLPNLIKKYKSFCKKNNIKPDYLKTELKFSKETEILKSIKQGEKEFSKNINNLSNEIRNLYKIMFILAKTICINLTTLKSYDKNSETGFLTILRIFDKVNKINKIDNLKDFITNCTKTNYLLMQNIISAQQERYGTHKKNSVSYSTTPSKALMVVGSNIRELEIILDKLQNSNIDVYTHDEMINAHTFPYFKKYKNLKGQFGQGVENCLLDFSTFPGPIILTKYSLFNVEHLYRGLLFTTDNAYLKGVIPIINYNFEHVIESAMQARGFKKGKICNNEDIGFDIDKVTESIKTKLNAEKYSHLIIIEQSDSDYEEYINNIIDKITNTFLVISLTPINEKNENIISLNACFNPYALIELFEQIQKFTDFDKLKKTVFFPKCDRHTISKMIYLKSFNNMNIFLGKCSPFILNPNLILTLNKIFEIKICTTAKNDLQTLFELN